MLQYAFDFLTSACGDLGYDPINRAFAVFSVLSFLQLSCRSGVQVSEFNTNRTVKLHEAHLEHDQRQACLVHGH